MTQAEHQEGKGWPGSRLARLDLPLGDVSEMGKRKRYEVESGGKLIFKREKYELGPTGAKVEDGREKCFLKGPAPRRSEGMSTSLGSSGGK